MRSVTELSQFLRLSSMLSYFAMSLMFSYFAILFSNEMSWVRAVTELNQFLRLFLPSLQFYS